MNSNHWLGLHTDGLKSVSVLTNHVLATGCHFEAVVFMTAEKDRTYKPLEKRDLPHCGTRRSE